jgi:outer membrane receptor protein involved in Fe transport
VFNFPSDSRLLRAALHGRPMLPGLRSGVFAVAATLLLALPVAGQDGQIVGQVVNVRTGAPIGQVQISLPGTGLGTLTRADGQFILLNVPPGTYELRAQQIGLAAVDQQVTVVAGGTVTANLQMETQALGLDEIVVTGTAGAARRREIGNTVAQINVDDVANRPTRVSDLLRSAAPGLDITSTGGEFGQAPAIRLRGNASLAMSNTPIVYIDGVRVRSEANKFMAGVDNRGIRGSVVQTSPLDGLMPSDIERIEVIKGSAATTLFGTEASAGVIQIFTKSGAQGAPVWTAETNQSLVWSRKFGTQGITDTGPECARTGVCNFDYFRLDPYLKTGYSKNVALSVRGGGEALRYFVSGGMSGDEGFLPNEYGSKRNIRGNFTFTPAQDLQIQWNTAYVDQWQQNVSTSNAQGLTHNVYRGEANYFGTDDIATVTRRVFDFDLQMALQRFTTGATVTYSPLANLTNRFTIGYDWIQQDGRNLRPFGFESRKRGALLNQHWQNELLTFDYVGTYSLNLTDDLRSSISWGGQAVGDEEHTVEAWGEDFPGAVEPTVSSAAFTLGFEERQKVWNAGVFFQNVFDFKNKYFFTVGARVDGNSAFGEGFGLQTYPKASVSWVVSDEGFWNRGGQLRLRAAYGQSGRAPGAFDAVRTWDPAGFANQPAFIPRNLGNPDLGPEVTTEMEAGFDASLFNDRLEVVFTYFDAKTSDALFGVRQPASEGFANSQLRNVGELKNKGVELEVNASPIETANWGWDVGLNVTSLKSEVLSLGGAPEFSLGSGGWVIEGQPAPVIRGRFVSNPDEIAAPVIEQNHIYGPNYPTLVLTPSMSFRIPGGVTLTAIGEYKGGAFVMVGNTTHGGVRRGAKMPMCFPYYQAPGVSTELKADTPALWRTRCTAKLTNGDFHIYPIDFFRLRTVAASIPMDFLFPDKVSNSILTLSLNESFSWIKDFQDLDPEVRSNQGADATVHTVANRTPMPISFRASLRITF